ncbi:hypothetical protein CFIO01_09966 [Colletotrichum fioriniae PJ7]|uniref:Mutanase n=1 Tax=Colletotrichum fioriniae PJ7 TaxID=1445577 RepID=A0A010S4H4_9PEZI|nr:hypothetical protein CFIO01_09966 [Colletotrichum fioriniae PJ7]
MRFLHGVEALAGVLSMARWSLARQRASFAHYMLSKENNSLHVPFSLKCNNCIDLCQLGTITAEHARKDIEAAKATGFDGFALNVGDATASFIDRCLSLLFDTAESIGGFGLCISMDVWASGDACFHGRDCCDGPMNYAWIFQKYKGRPSYYQWNGMPVTGTFSAADIEAPAWMSWKESLSNEMFFIPDFDATLGYYEAADGWCKLYMVPLSSIQYKNSYKTNVYRPGQHALPKRMELVLDTVKQADFVQFLTWNDGPESHYIAELWHEQNSDAQPWLYMNQERFSHTGWQPLVASLNHAFKNRLDANSMTPQNGAVAVGAMWHRSMIDGVTRNAAVQTVYTEKPSGYDDWSLFNQAFYSIVLKPGLEPEYTVVIRSGDEVITMALSSGINYNNGAGSIKAGAQSMEIQDPSGKTIMTARSKYCVSSGCPQGIYNMSYLVSPFEDGKNDADCKSIGAEVMPITSDLDAPVRGDDDDWTCTICDTTKVTLLTPASKKWSMGKTDDALEDFAARWKEKRFDYYRAYASNWSSAGSTCFSFDTVFPCGMGPLITSAWLLCSHLHEQDQHSFNVWLSAVAEATSIAQDIKDTFIDTFAYDPLKDVATQLISWILSQVFVVVGSQAFSGLSRIIGESEVAEGACTEMYGLAVEQINKQLEKIEGNKMTTVSDLAKMINMMNDIQTTTLYATMATYFNEEDPSFFNSQVRSGTWLKPAAESFTSLNLAKTMRQIFYGGLIQQSWNANPTMDPVVVVVDGESSDWGSLAATDIIASTYSAYKLNGNANGYNIAESNDNKQKDSNGNKQATLYPEGFRTPGVFSIPVCDYETAYKNFVAVGGWYHGPYDKCENYPCCSCEELGMKCDD